LTNFAAGIFPFCISTGRFLIAKRGPNINNPNVWTNFGGKSESGETPIQTAIREFREESGYKGSVKAIKSSPTKNPKDGLVFYNYIGIIPKEFTPTTIGKKTIDGDVEVSKCKWVNIEELYQLNPSILHPGFYRYLNVAQSQINKLSNKAITMELNQSIKSLINRLDENFNMWEEIEEELDEDANTTSNLDGGQGPQKTPYAFSKKVKEPDDPSYSERVTPTSYFYKKIEDNYNRLQNQLSEINYQDYKKDSTRTSTQKINTNIQEINKKLREVEQMINHASKLKLESGADESIFWKGTIGSFLKIKEKLNRLSNKIVEISG